MTPSGELVLLPRGIDVQLANFPVAEQLSARFGLSRIPQPPMRNRTGLYVLALRPVEFTANPVGAYPTSVTGQRTVEDGDVIEATAVVLVPWQDDGASDALDARRGRAARAIFTLGTPAGVSANVLPLAMLALQNNTVVWIDEAMVRRELGADRGDLPGLGFASRGLRLAHLMQHQAHLADVQLRSDGRGFPASAHFPALPPAGPLPKGVVNAQDFTQNYFPAEVEVDFTIIPEDELPALIEEALALQPIDLTVSPESLDSTAVMILAPVPRHTWRAVMARLESVQRVVKPAAPNLIARRKPFEILQKLRLPREALTTLAPVGASDAEWQRLAGLGTLWFVRRRHLAYRDDLVGSYKEISGIDERALEVSLNARITQLGLTPRLDFVLAQASPAAASAVISLLAAKRFQESAALTAAALGLLTDAISTAEQLEGKAALDKASVLGIAAVLALPEKNEALALLLKRESGGPIPADELLRIASNAEWNIEPVDDAALEARVFRRLDRIGLYDELKQVIKNAVPEVATAVIRLLASSRYEASPVLTAASLGLLSEPIVQGGFLKDTAIIASVVADLQPPIRSELLNKFLEREGSEAIPADELRKLVAITPDWRPGPVRGTPRDAPAAARNAGEQPTAAPADGASNPQPDATATAPETAPKPARPASPARSSRNARRK